MQCQPKRKCNAAAAYLAISFLSIHSFLVNLPLGNHGKLFKRKAFSSNLVFLLNALKFPKKKQKNIKSHGHQDINYQSKTLKAKKRSNHVENTALKSFSGQQR
jgi:hypothetical protein